MNVDLHCHSTASDGALAPAVLVARAFENGVRVLSLTDHDTLDLTATTTNVLRVVAITPDGRAICKLAKPA